MLSLAIICISYKKFPHKQKKQKKSTIKNNNGSERSCFFVHFKQIEKSYQKLNLLFEKTFILYIEASKKLNKNPIIKHYLD